MRYCRLVFAASAAWALCVRAQDATPTPATGKTLIQPEQITISGHFEAPLGPTILDRGIRSVGEQIDAKRAADAVRLQLSPIWDLAIWRYLPTDPAKTLNSRVASDDDPFFTPDYLKVSARQLDYQLKKSERAGQELLR
jgi:hypothetical protein